MSLEFVAMKNQKLDEPPTTNRGAENTDVNGLRALVDWFEGTLKIPQLYEAGENEMIELLGLDRSEFRELETGYRKWRKGLRLGSIQVYYGCPTEPSVHVIIPGQGCRDFETLSSVGWVEFFRKLQTLPFSYGRTDLAIDDFGHVDPRHPERGKKPYFSVATLIRRTEQGLCRSKFEKGRPQGTIDLDTGEYQGRTMYFGSSKSRIQIRVYEKHWERKNKGYELEDGVDLWNRTELELRKERAEEAVKLIAQGIRSVGEIVSGVIKNYVNFVDKDKDDTNKGRWKVSKFWNDFLGDVEPLKLTSVAPDRTIARVERWVDHQVEPSLSLLWLANDGQLDWLIEMLEDGCDRLSDRDLEMLERTKLDYQKAVARRKQEKLDEERTEKLVELHKKPKLDEFQMAEADRKQMERRLSHKKKNARSDVAETGHTKL